MARLTIDIPPEIYTSDKACGEFIFELNQRLAKLSEIEKAVKEAKDIATQTMLDRLEATGQKHFAFEGLGTFKKSTSVKLSFPTAENGGKETAVKWLEQCLARGVITPAQLLDLQQARLVTEPVLAIEQAVADYNQQQILNGSTDLLPESPFNRFEQTTLSTPRTRRA